MDIEVVYRFQIREKDTNYILNSRATQDAAMRLGVLYSHWNYSINVYDSESDTVIHELQAWSTLFTDKENS